MIKLKFRGGVYYSLQNGSFGHGTMPVSSGLNRTILMHDQDVSTTTGGKFGNVTKGGYFDVSNMVERIVTSALVGGTESAISDGKFANGALTGAFNQLYNGKTCAAKKWQQIKSFASDAYNSYINSICWFKH